MSGAPWTNDMVVSLALTLAVPSQTATEGMCYKFVWCFQDGRVHPVLPDCLGDAMLPLRPENLRPLTKGTLVEFRGLSQSELSGEASPKVSGSVHFVHANCGRSQADCTRMMKWPADLGSGHSTVDSGDYSECRYLVKMRDGHIKSVNRSFPRYTRVDEWIFTQCASSCIGGLE